MTSTHLLVALAVSAIIRPWRVPSRPLPKGADTVAPERGGIRFPPNALWGLALVGSTWVSPILGCLVLVAPGIRRWRRMVTQQQRHHHRSRTALPETIDLIVIGVGAGLSVRGAMASAGPWFPEPYRSAFDEALRRADLGESFAAALATGTDDLGPAARPLVSTLVAADRDGGALVAALVREGDDARRRRRVAAEERARRLPVTMLLPLVFCVLPAFGLIAVVPLLISSLGDLGVGL